MNVEPAALKTKMTQEELLRDNARLRGDLLTIARRISHDLRTPLGGIISANEALKEILAETDPSAIPLVASSLDSAEEMSQLIKRVSFVLKATALPASPQPVSMDETVWATTQRLENRILKSGATISQPASWPEVRGVSEWLEVVWWNLLANALRHAGATPQIELGWREQDGQFQFWVADNGPGVSEARRAKLFQPFQFLHEPDSIHGLGLSIVQRLVELQGGSCRYEPNPRGGACFIFTLPTISPRKKLSD
jgi:K+-sensing histidine kinase KdpD